MPYYAPANRRTLPRGVSTSTPADRAAVDQVDQQDDGGGGLISGIADMARRVVPQRVRDVAGTGVQAALSGERAANLLLPGDPGTAVRNQIERIPVVGGVAGEVADMLTSPLTLATLGFGGAASTALRAGRLGTAGRAAAPFIEPVVAGNLGRRAIGEAGMAVGGAAGNKVAEAADLPGVAQVGLTIAGAVLGARSARGITNTAEHLRVPRITPDEVKAAVESGDPTAKLTAVLRGADKVIPEQKIAQHGELQKRTAEMAAELQGVTDPSQRSAIIASRSKGELPKVDFSPNMQVEAGVNLGRVEGRNLDPYWSAAESAVKFTADDVRSMQQRIVDFPGFAGRVYDEQRARLALNKVFAAELPQPAELKLLERVFGPEFANSVDSLRGRGWTESALDILGLPRAVMSSWDMSAPFRQGAILVGRGEFWGNMAPMARAFTSEKYAHAAMEDILTNPVLQDAISKHGLAFTEISGLAQASAREESFMTRFAARIPLVKNSEQAYVTYLNKLRADMYGNTVARWGERATDMDKTALAHWLNTATGRGNLPSNEFVAGMNQLFFSPRLLASRVEMMSGKALLDATPLVRKEVARDLTSFFGAGIGALTIAKMSGIADVNLDPRSSDFAKIHIGNSRIDPWAGFQPIARYLAQVIKNEAVSSTGDVRELNRMTTLGRFAQSKLAPGPGLIVDALRGENFLGQETDFRTGDGLGAQAASRLTPLFVQDLYEAYKTDGLQGVALTTPAVVGFGAQTYTSVSAVREAGAEEMFKMGWNDLNGEEKSAVEQAYAEELAKQDPPQEGSITAFVEERAQALRAFEQDANTARQQGLIDARTFTEQMVQENGRRVEAIDVARERAGLADQDSGVLDDYFALRDQATVAGVTDYELLDQLQENFLRSVSPRDREIVERRRTFLHAPEVQWWTDARDRINSAGYWDVQSASMDRVRGLIERAAPGVQTYNQLLAASRDPNLSRVQQARLEAVIKRVDSLTRDQRERLRQRNPDLDAALVEVYGLTPIRQQR